MWNFAVFKRMALLFFTNFIGFSLMAPPARAVAWDLGLVTIKREWVRIPVDPGVELIGTLYQKRGLKVDGPLVILLNPWSIGSWVYGLQANALAEKGFTVLSYNLRGWAGSQGTVDNGGAVDVADVSRVIDWVSQTYHLDVSEVGVGGVSLGAGVALNAAAFEPRIRAVASMSTWTNFYTPIYGNSTKRVFWDAVLWLGSVIGTGSPAAAKLKDTYEAIENGDYAQIHEYADPRSPVFFLDRFAVNKPAILLSQNMSDILFPVSDVWTFFESLPVPKKMNLQPGVHATAEITGMFLPFKDKVWDDSIEWFERWLKPHHPSHDVMTSEIQVTLRDGQMFAAEKTSDLAPAKGRFYLERYTEGKTFGKLVSAASPSGIHTIESGKSSGVVSGLPLLGALVSETKIFGSKMKETSIRLDQAALYEFSVPDQGFRLLGVPRVHLSFRVHGDPATFITHLFRLDRKGAWHLMSMTPYTVRGQPDGSMQTVEFDLYGAFESFDAGDRLILAIDTQDPEFKQAKGDYTLSFDNSGGSWIDLPLSRIDSSAEFQ